MAILDLTKPGLYFLEVAHDGWCPTLATGNGGDCQCSPTMRLHQDTDHFVRGEVRGRKQRREAQREAEKAMRRAARSGGKGSA